MYAVAYAILGNVSQSEDTVQDSFVKVADYLDRIKDVVDPSDVIEKKLSEIHNSTILLDAAKDMAQIYKEVIDLVLFKRSLYD